MNDYFVGKPIQGDEDISRMWGKAAEADLKDILQPGTAYTGWLFIGNHQEYTLDRHSRSHHICAQKERRLGPSEAERCFNDESCME